MPNIFTETDAVSRILNLSAINNCGRCATKTKPKEEILVMAERKKIQQKLIECLGKVVAQRRKRLGMSQEELAESSGVDRAFISKIERGRRNPSFALISHISHGLHMRYSRLVSNCEQCVQDKKSS